MTYTKVWLADGSVHVVRIAADFIEEAADNEEIVPATDGKLIDLSLVDSYAVTDPPKD